MATREYLERCLETEMWMDGRFQTPLEELALWKGLWLIYRLLAYYYNYFINVSIIIYLYSQSVQKIERTSLSLSLSSFYHQHFMLCAVSLYMYCRSHNTNDCLHLISSVSVQILSFQANHCWPCLRLLLASSALPVSASWSLPWISCLCYSIVHKTVLLSNSIILICIFCVLADLVWNKLIDCMWLNRCIM